MWGEHRIENAPSWRKTIDHPQAGQLAFDYASVVPQGEPAGLTLTVYTPADAATAKRFQALLGAR
jgi:hypothetical protein